MSASGFLKTDAIDIEVSDSGLSDLKIELSRGRRKHVTLVTKSNALRYGYVLWDEVLDRLTAEFPDIRFDKLQRVSSHN